MPLGPLYHSEPTIRTSSTSSGNEESSTKDKPSGKKTKKYVKKKGDTRKRNSKDVSEGKNAAELADEILKKLDNMVIKNEIESGTEPQGASNCEFFKLGEKMAIDEAKNKKGAAQGAKKGKKVESSGKSCSTAESEGSKVGGKLDEIDGELKEKKGDAEVTKKDSMIEFGNNKPEEKDHSKYILGVTEKDFQKIQKNVDGVKRADQHQQQDREKMRILKGVTKFSKKFMKAIKKLEDGNLNKDSSSTSESSESSSTDSSSSSSCSCSSCSEIESSTCSCSDCCSEKSSTCSCSNSNLESSGTSSSSFSSLTSSGSSTSSTTCTSASGITSPKI